MTRLAASAAALALVAIVASATALADVVTTSDGARLTGTIQKITPKTIELKTTYAGTITVTMDQVATVATDAPVTTRLTDETTVTGVTVIDATKTITVKGDAIATTASLDKLKATWPAGTTPPPESGYDAHRWVYTLGADLVGKNGNSDEMTTNIVGDALLVSRVDELKLYGSYQRSKQESKETSDQTIAGASYNAFMYDPWGWYVRGEVERDPFEDIELRTTLAGGLSVRPINTPVHMLRFFLGVGYRNESFSNGDADNSVGTLDAGLSHRWILKPWLTMTNDVTYAPAFDDFGDYLLMQDSAFEMPVGTGSARKWLLRLGLRNDYKSQPADGRENLDTAYYVRLLLRFD